MWFTLFLVWTLVRAGHPQGLLPYMTAPKSPFGGTGRSVKPA